MAIKPRINASNAKAMQLKSAAARKENGPAREKAYRMFQKFMLGKKTVTKKDLEELGDDVQEFKVNKKAVRVLLDLAKMRKKAIDTANVRGYVDLLKTAGFHFDQSPEALGGSDNPINVNNRIGPPSEEFKEAMAEQARLLGVVDDD